MLEGEIVAAATDYDDWLFCFTAYQTFSDH